VIAYNWSISRHPVLVDLCRISGGMRILYGTNRESYRCPVEIVESFVSHRGHTEFGCDCK